MGFCVVERGRLRFEPSLLEDIKARIRTSDLVGRTVELKRSGREFRGLSPFNKERTPSFFVNDDKKAYFCFSSGKSGDIFTWLIETEGVSFPEAVERLAGEAGVALPAEDPQAAKKAEARRDLIGWLEAANEVFQAQLRRGPGAEARAYLERRGFSAADWPRFEIGYAPDAWSTVKDHLINKGAREEELLRAGLIAQSREGKRTFDYFRGRVMFPIRDPAGRLVAFGGRTLIQGEPAKYLNSPETELFHKGSALYRYPEARASIAAARGDAAPRGLILAEGYMDVIALARAGFAHAVAPLGTAVTEEQLELVWRAGPEPILCFDGDAAGRRAAFRVIDRALPLVKAGRSLSFALLPGGQDPDDLIRASGPEAMGEALTAARPLIDMVWEREHIAAPLDTPEQRADLKGRLFGVAAKIGDAAVAEQYKLALLERFDKHYGRAAARTARQKSFTGTAWRPAGQLKGGPSAQTRVQARAAAHVLQAEAERLLAALIAAPELVVDAAETLAALTMPSPGLESIQSALLDAAVSTSDIDKEVLEGQFARLGCTEAAARLTADLSSMDALLSGRDLAAWLSAAQDFSVRIGAKTAEADALAAAKASRAAGDRDGMRAAFAPVTTEVVEDDADESGDVGKRFDAAMERAAEALARKTGVR